MPEKKVAERVVDANQQEWFWMLVSYMKMRTLAVWLYNYPLTHYDEFEFVWPILFDHMLSSATRATMKRLKQLDINYN